MNRLVSEMAQSLCKLRGMEILLRVGLDRGPSKGKIDFLAGCHDGRIERYSPAIETLLRKRWPTGNFSVCDDSIRFNLQSGTGGVAVCDSTLLVKQTEKWIKGEDLTGQRRSWATGYWIPEALCGDLATAETLHDPTGINPKLRELLIPYRSSLSEAIIELCTDEITQRLSALEKLRKNATAERNLCVSDITAAMIRLAFARSRKYLRGFRSLDSQAKLLLPSDQPIYKLARMLSRQKRVNDAIGKIRELL